MEISLGGTQMLFKKLIPLFLCILLALCGAGCKKNPATLSVDKGDEPVSSAPVAEPEKVETAVNPLTGLDDISPLKAGDRPVAIMVNNISVAQPVQTGLNKADVIYETEVEGGITRLMAVFQDISKVEKIGTVRSARYVYIDLAMGHNAIYVHHGTDTNYAAPHLKDTDNFVLDSNNAGIRISNGLASEHTLYAYGDKVWKNLVDSDRTIKNKNTATWLNFADKESPVKFTDAAENVSVKFSGSYTTEFKYDSASERYTRYFKGVERKDYYTGDSVTVKNIFVLNTDMSHYPIVKYRKIGLESGSGYYIVNGTCTKIQWSKGASSNSFVFKNTDGTELTVNPGNSWVCIVDKNNGQPVIS